MLTNLTELWLGKNKITKLENIDQLVNLRILSIQVKHPLDEIGLRAKQFSQSNRITKIEGLDSLTKLEDLYISHNGLEEISGLDNNVRSTRRQFSF